MVHCGGLYYVVGSHLTSWAPNPNVYATARSLAGPWSKFENIAPPETNTYGSQSSMLLKVVGRKGAAVIFMADVLEARLAVGLALFMDAVETRRRQALASETAGVDDRRENWRNHLDG